MSALQTTARELLDAGDVKVVVGYELGTTSNRRRPCFIRQSDQVHRLMFDANCHSNLAVYLLKPEVRALGKAAIVAHPGTLRTILQYAAENQLVDGAVLSVAVTIDGKAAVLNDFAAIEQYLASVARRRRDELEQEIAALDQMPREKRWAYWSDQMASCVKCYACRAACPLCYCSRCITDMNQPQWLPVASTPLGNLEWNVVRAMHLAGRCIDCGACAAACPQGIRIDLLNFALSREMQTQFGAEAGYSMRRGYALSTWQAEDREAFIR